MGGKKALLLFTGLLLPVLVFVFLKLFGKNEFDVPLLYEKGVPQKPAGCKIAYTAPYLLDDSVVRNLLPDAASLAIVNFGNASRKLQQISETFSGDAVLIDGSRLAGEKQQITFIKNCILLTTDPNTIVLIDNKKQIRGHYNGEDRDELDRLEAELNIILKRY